MVDDKSIKTNEKNFKGFSKSITMTLFLISAFMAYFPFFAFLEADYLHVLLVKAIVFSTLLIVIIIPMIGFLFLKSFYKSAFLFLAFCLVSYGEINTYIGMNKSVSESDYEKMFKIIKNEKTPISIKKYLYDVSRDGTVTYLEWLKFDTMYGLYMSTHKKDVDFGQSEQNQFLKAIERVMM